MEELKNLFSHSEDIVVITDHDFNILWSNSSTSIFHEYGKCCRELFCGIPMPLKSRRYEVVHKGLVYECNVINYPHGEKGIYVLITEKKDLLMSFLSKIYIKNFFENQTGAIRNALTGLTMSNMELKRLLESQDKNKGMELLERNKVNACKMMHFAASVNELIRYTEKSDKVGTYDLAEILDIFIERSRKTLGELHGPNSGSIVFKGKYSRELYIKTDHSRLEACLLSLAVLTVNMDESKNIVMIQAGRKGKDIVLTFSSGFTGQFIIPRVYSQHIDMHDSEEYKICMLIVRAFCSRYECTLCINKDKAGDESYSLIMPPASSELVLEAQRSNYGTILDNYDFFYSQLL